MPRVLSRLRKALMLLGALYWIPGASAEGLVVFCYNWDCKARVAVVYGESWLHKNLHPLRQAKTPEDERVAAAEVVRRFYVHAAQQSPIGSDQPGNDEDPDVSGRMDCIDHSASTKNILSLLKQRQQLRWHEVGPYAHRTFLVDSHYSATLVETAGISEDTPPVYTIDPWQVAPGALPELASVREWAGPRFYSLETQHHTQTSSALPGR